MQMRGLLTTLLLAIITTVFSAPSVEQTARHGASGYTSSTSTSRHDSITCNDDAHQISFMGKCFCEPGWESSSGFEPLNCTSPIVNIEGCKCDRLNPISIDGPHAPNADTRCIILCNSNSQLGVIRSIPTEWKKKELTKQLPFYKSEYRKMHDKQGTHLKNRLLEFTSGFDNWSYLNNTSFGDVIEFGAGPYTQLRNIMENINVSVSSATLVEPLLQSYMGINGCSYESGQLVINNKSLPTTLSNLTVEEYGKTSLKKQYDTVIIMNVANCALNLFDLLQTVHKASKPNGLLIFHERYYINYAKSSHCGSAGFRGVYVIMPSKGLMDHFLSFYDTTPFINGNQTAEQKMRSKEWCHMQDDEHGYFAAVRKKNDKVL